MLRFNYSTSSPADAVQLYKSENGGSSYSFIEQSIENPFYLSIEDLGYNKGDVISFSLKAIYAKGQNSNYSRLATITINGFCSSPSNLTVNNGNVFWSSSLTVQNSYYQVQYGQQGFTIGNGTVVTTNDTSTGELSFMASQVYDVYVRSFCSDSQQFSAWIGPVSYFATTNQNVCTPPTNVGYSIEYNFFGEAVGAIITWSDTGNNGDYEYNLVEDNQSPTSNAVESGIGNTVTYLQMYQNTEYDFYVRTKCLNGTFTNWVGPLNVNIGF